MNPSSPIRKYLPTGRKLRLLMPALLLILATTSITSSPLFFEPRKTTLPDGRELNLFVSGDEFFNWLHDTLGYPVKKAADGYYYYMLQNDSVFTFTPFRACEADPGRIAGLKPVVVPSNVPAIREHFFAAIDKENNIRGIKGESKYTGVYNNLVIYIKFSDQSDFTTSRSTYDSRFNSLTSASVRHYYREISYDKIDMVSYHMPGGPTENICYTDIYPRNYYSPYDAATNPAGYATSTEKRTREHNLLARAVNYVNDNYQKPDGVNFDNNNDGYFDNIAFIIRGSSDAWSDLLWPHRWVLSSVTVNLWQKKVYSYTFQMDNVSVKTFTHEMFHSLGAPDLYHYTSDGMTPVGTWDLMASGGGHPTAWMKAKYGGWINIIPQISESGTYTMLPLTSSSRNSYRIASPYSSDEFFVVEFRKKTGLYENNLPSTGIIIYRVDSRYKGNAQGPPDEVYVFRPGGTTDVNGTINSATFSDLLGRTTFNETTNPRPFLQDGSGAAIFISDIRYHTDSMTFTVDLDMPRNLVIDRAGDTQLGLTWSGPSDKSFLVAVSPTAEPLVAEPSPAYSQGDPIGTNGTIVYKGTSRSFTHTGLVSDDLYHYTLWTIIDEASGRYSVPLTGSERTSIHTINQYPHLEDFATSVSLSLPRGWKAEGGETQWSFEVPGGYSAPGSVMFRNLGTGAAWFYTPGFLLSNQKKYLITFRYRSFIAGSRETISLNAGTSRHNGGLTNHTVFYDNRVSYSDYVLCRAVFKPVDYGVWYFGLKSSTTGQGVLFDDFKIEPVPDKTVNLYEPVDFFPNPSTGRITIPAREKTTVSIHLPGGIPLITRVIEGTTDIDLSQLRPGLYIITFTSKAGTSTAKLVLTTR